MKHCCPGSPFSYLWTGKRIETKCVALLFCVLIDERKRRQGDCLCLLEATIREEEKRERRMKEEEKRKELKSQRKKRRGRLRKQKGGKGGKKGRTS